MFRNNPRTQFSVRCSLLMLSKCIEIHIFVIFRLIMMKIYYYTIKMIFNINFSVWPKEFFRVQKLIFFAWMGMAKVVTTNHEKLLWDLIKSFNHSVQLKTIKDIFFWIEVIFLYKPFKIHINSWIARIITFK